MREASPLFGSPPPGVACEKRKAAYAVIHRADGRVAVVRASGKWFLPGGASLTGETPEQTVSREIEEECGRRARILERAGEAIQYFYSPTDGRWYEMLAVFFSAELEPESVGIAEYKLDWINASTEASAFFHPCHAWAAAMAPPPKHS